MKEVRFILSLMTPRVWVALLVLVALALVAGAGFGGLIGYRVADSQGAARLALAVDELAGERLDRAQEKTKHAAQLAVEVRKVAETERQWRDDIGSLAEIHKEQMDDAQQKIRSLRNDVLTGAVRLSIAVAAPTAASGNAPGAGAAAAGGDQEARAELMPQAADDLISIAADGDDAVRDLNVCIDAYQAIAKKKDQQ